MDRSLATVGGNHNATTPRAPTLNERLNRVLERIQSEADRIERCLGRINGTPQPAREKDSAQIQPTRNLSLVVEEMEKQAERLRHLSENVDQIA